NTSARRQVRLLICCDLLRTTKPKGDASTSRRARKPGGNFYSVTLGIVKNRHPLLPLLLATASIIHAQEPSVEQQYQAAQRALASGNYAQAQAQLEKLAAANPALAEVHANLGLVYFQERKLDQAIPELRKAMKLKPSLTNSSYILAMS